MEHLLFKNHQVKLDPIHRTRWLGFNHPTVSPTSFTTYPSARGWNKTNLLKGDLEGAHPNQHTKSTQEIVLSSAGMIQSWLYFGFIEGMTGKQVNIDDFVTPDSDTDEDGFKFLHSNKLLHVLKNWRPLIMAYYFGNPDRVKSSFDQLGHDLSEAKSICFELAGTFGLNPTQTPKYPSWPLLLEMILPSIILMLEAVVGVTKKFYQKHPGLQYRYIFFPPEAERGRIERLVRLGWCPFTISKLRKMGDNSLLSWIDVSGIKRDNILVHAECDESECRLYQVDTSSYETKHVSSECTCEFVSPSLETIQQILSHDMIPCITAVEKDTQLRLEVTAFSSGTRLTFITFSHVWADGLGSVSEKGLPTCQIRRLSQMVSCIPNCIAKPTFWIDSLCVPSETVSRKKAILLMSKTYSEAAGVIILDRQIQNFSPTTCIEEFLLTICGSGWMERLWTYQEAALSRKLIFMTKDGLLELDPTASGLPRASLPLSTIWLYLSQYLEKLRKRPKEKGQLIGVVHSTLRWRNTSKEDDETLAIAGILDIDVSQLIESMGEERKAKFWKLLEIVPKNIIHLAGPKLRIEGFKWAPRTLMYHLDGANTMNFEGEARCTDTGLVGEWEALVLREGPCINMPGVDIYLGDEDELEWVYHLTSLEDGEGEFIFNAVLLSGPNWKAVDGDATIATVIHIFGDGVGDGSELVAECTQRMGVRRLARELLKITERLQVVRIRNLHLRIV
jgi:hypothetical protein